MNEIIEKVTKLLSENGMGYYDIDVDANNIISITVEDGDWKHDHLALDNIMAKNGYSLLEKRPFEENTGGDWYSAVHVFI